jgi:hypothetical protein
VTGATITAAADAWITLVHAVLLAAWIAGGIAGALAAVGVTAAVRALRGRQTAEHPFPGPESRHTRLQALTRRPRRHDIVEAA